MIQEFAINDIRLACWINDSDFEAGKKCMVFIHGSGGDHAIWEEQYRVPQSEFNIVAVDLPGHGLSGGSPLK